MSLRDLPLDDAGRNYYARQFDGRLQNIRKSGGSPSGKPGCLGVGGGVFAIFVIIRLLMGLASGWGDSYSGSYNNYNYVPPPTYLDPPPDWKDVPPERDVLPDQPIDPNFGQPDKPFVLPPNAPFVVPPEGPPNVDPDPPAPPDDDKDADKDM